MADPKQYLEFIELILLKINCKLKLPNKLLAIK
jgi:hypothetical protein